MVCMVTGDGRKMSPLIPRYNLSRGRKGTFFFADPGVDKGLDPAQLCFTLHLKSSRAAGPVETRQKRCGFTGNSPPRFACETDRSTALESDRIWTANVVIVHWMTV